MNGGSIARRYARALLAIAAAERVVDALSDELGQVVRLLGQADLLRTLVAPNLPPSERKALLRTLLDRLPLSPHVVHLCLLLQDRGRIALVGAIAREYGRLADQHEGRVRAEVVGAQRLEEATIRQLRTVLAQRLGKEVLAQQTTDPALIGGIITRVGSLLFDGSIRGQLQALRETFLHEGWGRESVGSSPTVSLPASGGS